MKKLLLAMMAVLLVNVSYAGDVGEDLKGECKYQVQSSRSQEQVADDAQAEKPEVQKAGTRSK